MPAHATSTGLAQLSFLPPEEVDRRLGAAPLRALTERTVVDPDRIRQRLETIRQRGYAVVEEEAAQGEMALAAPILDQRGHPPGGDRGHRWRPATGPVPAPSATWRPD